MWRDAFKYDVTHLYGIWLIHVGRDSFMCDTTHHLNVNSLIHVWYDSLITCVTWLIHMWRDAFICNVNHLYGIWLIHTWRDSFICDTTHHPARKASWNPAGIETVHWKPADINPGSLKWVKIKMHLSSELMIQIKLICPPLQIKLICPPLQIKLICLIPCHSRTLVRS